MNIVPQPAALSRRSFLRGAGVCLALPLLEAMRPAFSRAAAVEAPRRLVTIQTNQGIMPHLFFPEKAGRDYELSPYLKLLEPLRSEFTVFSGLSHPGVDGGHANEVSFLTGAPHPAGAAFRNSISLDQLAAERIGTETQFASLIVSGAASERSMSYNRSGVLIPPESDLARLYRTLFVQGTPKQIEARLEDLRAGRSLLDTVRERAKRLENSVNPADRSRLDQYFTSIRELEGQLLTAESWEQKPKPKVAMAEPKEIKDSAMLITRLRTMYDIIKLALENDSTRVVSIFIQPLGVISEIGGVAHETHSLTHHGNRPEMMEELRKIEEAQLTVFRDFLTGLHGVANDGHTLLDRTSVLYGTCMGNANGHSNKNWPMLLAGGGFKHGQHLAFDAERNEPIAKLYVSLLQRLGIESDEFSSGKGTIGGLAMT
ncbi:MAG TPA: DUF1552 domain-containing protein [Chthoniobacteraceae bacterium]|jgi:hypothetical protein|nr:DUF1552 domain-containing protein [Chthoniobacteraceae bacterium]